MVCMTLDCVSQNTTHVSEVNYSTVRVDTSIVSSDHKTAVVHSRHQPVTAKSAERKTFCKITPKQHALFVQRLQTVDCIRTLIDSVP